MTVASGRVQEDDLSPVELLEELLTVRMNDRGLTQSQYLEVMISQTAQMLLLFHIDTRLCQPASHEEEIYAQAARQIHQKR